MIKKQVLRLVIWILVVSALVALPRGIGIQTIVRIIPDDTHSDPLKNSTNGTSGIHDRFTSNNLNTPVIVRNALRRQFLLDIISVLEKMNLSNSFVARLSYIYPPLRT